MRKEQRIPKSKIPEAIEALKALDKKELDDVSAREAIKNMRRQIERVLKLGYTYEEVSETLAGLDINISPQRIKYFLAQIRKSNKKKSQSKNKVDNKPIEDLVDSSKQQNNNSINDTAKPTQNRQSNSVTTNTENSPTKPITYPKPKNTFEPVIIKNEDL